MATLPTSSGPAPTQAAGPTLPGTAAAPPKTYPVTEPLPGDGSMPDLPQPRQGATQEELMAARDEGLANSIRVVNDAFRQTPADDTYRTVYIAKRLDVSSDTVKKNLKRFEKASRQVTANFSDPNTRNRWARFLTGLRQEDEVGGTLHIPEISLLDGASKTLGSVTSGVTAVVTGALDVLQSIPAPWTDPNAEDAPVVEPKTKTAGEAWKGLVGDVKAATTWDVPEPRPYTIVGSNSEVLDTNARVLDQQRARARAQVAVFVGRARGKSERELAPYESVLLEKPVLPARTASGEASNYVTIASAVQNVISTYEGVLETQGAPAAIATGLTTAAGLAASAVGAGKLGKVTLGRTLGKAAARVFGGTVVGATLPAAWVQETGGFLEEVQDLPGFKQNPDAALGAAALYGALSSAVEAGATAAEVAAVLGVPPATLAGVGGRKALFARLKQGIIANVRKDPGGAFMTAVKEIGAAGLAAAKAEGGEEFTQGTLSALAKKVGQLLTGENTLDIDALMRDPGESFIPGAIGGLALGAPASAVRVVGASVLAPKLGKLQSLHLLIAAADAAAKASPASTATRPPTISADLRRAAALHGPTAYVEVSKLARAVESVAQQQNIPTGEAAARLGVAPYVVSDSAIAGTIVPVSLHDVMTKWTTQGLTGTDVLQYLSAEVGGPTAATKMAELEAVSEAEAYEKTRQERLAVQTESARKLVRHFAGLTTEQQQAALYHDDVSGAMSAEALQDMAEHLGNAGYVLTIWSHQGQKAANDALDHDTADALYRTAARQLSSQYEFTFKVGGDLVTAHKSDFRGAVRKHREVREAAAPAMPGNAGLLGTVAEFARDSRGRIDFKGTFDAAAKSHRSRINALRQAKQWATRGRAPLLEGERAGILTELAGTVGLKDRRDVVRARREVATERFTKAVQAAAARKEAPIRQAIPPQLLAGWDSSPEGLQRTAERLYVRKGSALLSSRAYGLLEKIAPHKHTLPIDLRGLGDINRKSSDLADQVNLMFGAAVHAVAPKGVDLRVAHLHGDEYVASCDDAGVLNDFLKAWRKIAQDRIILEMDREDGSALVVDGIEFFGEVHPVSTYAEADKLANQTKKLLDKEAREVVRWNEQELAAAQKEGRNANLKPIPAGSRAAGEARFREVPADRRGSDVLGRRAGVPVGQAAAVRTGPSGANLEGLADLLLAQEVDRTSTAIRARANLIAAEIADLLKAGAEPDFEAQGLLVRRLNDVVTDLIEEVTWRVNTSTSRSPAETNEDFVQWTERLKKNQQTISTAALRVEESARKAIAKALKDAKALLEAPTVEAYKADRIKADPLYRLHSLLVKGTYYDADGTKQKFHAKANFSDFSAYAAQGLIPQAAVDGLKEAGAFAPTGGMTLPALLNMAGIDTDLTPAEWADVVTPPPTVTAAKQAALRKSAHLASTKLLQDITAAGLETVGEHLGSEWFVAEEKAGRSTQQQGPGGSPIKAIRLAALRHVSALRKGDLSLEAMRLAEQRAATKAVLYAVRGKTEQALAFRQEQLSYQYAGEYARSGIAQHAKLKKTLRDLSKNDTLRRIGQGSPEALNFVGGILNHFSRGGGRFPNVKPDLMAILTQIAEEDATATFRFSPDVVFGLIERDEATLDDVTTEEAEHLVEVLRTVTGYAARKARDIKAVADFQAQQVAFDLQEDASARNVPYEASSEFGAALTVLREHFQGITRSGESVFAVLGRLGPHMHDTFFKPAVEAVNRHDALAKDILGGYVDLMAAHSIDESQVQPLDMDRVRQFLPEQPNDTRNTTDLRRSWALSIALNAGNLGNLHWLLTQEGWSYAQVQDFLNDTLTEKEWAFVEATWKFMDEKVYPLVEAHYRSRWGFVPKKVEATPMWVPKLGRYVRGGYFPVRFDTNSWVSWRTSTADEMSEIHGTAHQASAMMNKSFTEARHEFSTMEELLDYDPMAHEVKQPMPLDLRLGILPYHLEEVTHYVAYEDMVLRLWRLTQNATFQNTVRRYGGKGALPQITDWIKDVARGRADSWPQSLDDTVRAVSYAVSATTAGFVGANIPLQATDLVNSLVPAAIRTFAFGKDNKALTYTPKALLSVYRRAVSGDYRQMAREAFAQSAALRALMEDRELDQIKSTVIRLKQGGPAEETMLDWSRRAQWYGYEAVTRITAVLGWNAKILDAESRGLSREEALREAEEFISAFVVSHKAEFKAALLRNNVVFAEFSKFLSFFFKVNGEYVRRALHPLAVQIVGDARADRFGRVAVDSAKLVAANVAALVFTGLVAELIAGSGPDDKDKLWNWTARKLAANKLRAVPVYGILFDPIISAATGQPQNPRTGPTGAVVASLLRSVTTAFDERKATDKRVWAAISALLLALKLPARQVERTGSYVTGELSSDLALGNYAQAIESLLYGADRRGMTIVDAATGNF